MISLKQNEIYFADNLLELDNFFELRIDKKYASGSMYICKKCNAVCRSEETFFVCQNTWVPTRIVCDVCKKRWRLEICNTCTLETN